MSAHCCHTAPVFDGRDRSFRRALWVVIALNAAMFIVEMAAGAAADSQALQADALDFFADTLTYGLSLAVIGRTLALRNRVAMFKAVSLAAMGLWVLGATLWQALGPVQPQAVVMGTVGFLALTVNLLSVLLLRRWRAGDANIRSVWLCSRNDALGNVAVMLAALGVFGTGTPWPDLIVATIMSGLFLSSAVQIFRRALVS